MKKIFDVTIIVISATMFLNFMFTAGFGVYKTFHAFQKLVMEGPESKPGMEIIESLDLFLVALVFLILSLTFIKLFCPHLRLFDKISLPWLKVDDFFQLKHLTWSAMLLTLLITFGTYVLRGNGQLEWNMLVIPISVALFSVAGKLLKH